MSKQALSYLLKEFTKKEDSAKSVAGSSKPYRKEFLDKNKQIFELGTVEHIADELAIQIEIAEISLLSEQLITRSDLVAAAQILKTTFLARVKAANVVDPANSVVV